MIKYYIRFLKNSTSKQRRIILAIFDYILISFSLFITSDYFIKYSIFDSIFDSRFIQNINILFLALIGIILYLITGQYTALTRYATSKTVYYLA